MLKKLPLIALSLNDSLAHDISIVEHLSEPLSKSSCFEFINEKERSMDIGFAI